MMHTHKQPVGIAVLSLLLLGTLNFGAGIKAKDIVKKVKDKYRSLQTLSADFTQIFKWELAGETQKFTGKIYLKKKDKYRIEMEDQIVVTDGETLWTYSKANRQVIIDYLKKSQDNPLPEELFFKYSEQYESELLGKEKIEGQQCYLLQLLPKTQDVFITKMKVWIDSDNWITKKIEHTDINNNTNTYILHRIEMNVELSDSLFIFNIPEGIEVINLKK